MKGCVQCRSVCIPIATPGSADPSGFGRKKSTRSSSTRLIGWGISMTLRISWIWPGILFKRRRYRASGNDGYLRWEVAIRPGRSVPPLLLRPFSRFGIRFCRKSSLKSRKIRRAGFVMRRRCISVTIVYLSPGISMSRRTSKL